MLLKGHMIIITYSCIHIMLYVKVEYIYTVKGNCFLKNFASTLHAIKSNVVYGTYILYHEGWEDLRIPWYSL